MFYRNSEKHCYVNTLRVELRLFRGLVVGYTRVKSASSTDAMSLQIGFPPVLSRGSHLDFKALQ